MKKRYLSALVVGLSFFMVSCAGGESPASCAKKYCELNAKYRNAVSNEEKLKTRKERDDYENELETEYKGNTEFFKSFEKEVEKCGGGG